MSKNLKIAIIGSRGYPYVYSGYETLVKELSERLVNSGHHVKVYCHSSLFKKKPRQVNGIELIYTPSIETKFLSQIINSFFSFIHVCFSNVDLVLVVNSANGPFGILTKFFKKKTCVNVDGLEWLRPKWRGLGSFYFKLSSKLSTIFFDEVITDCNEMSKIYYDLFRTKSTTIAYGPTMIKNSDLNILGQYNLQKKEYYLIVGRLVPDNNCKLILEGFIKTKTNKKIVVVGDVPYKDNYAKEVKSFENDNIVFTGYISNQKDLTSLYFNCYGYIHGHEYGGTNPTMINALYLNCNILALDTKFNCEMLKGKSALFFKKNTNSLKEKIEEFENIYYKLIEINKCYKFPKEYQWDYINNKYLKLFFKITNSKNK